MSSAAITNEYPAVDHTQAIDTACQLIAPVWPLDEFIAVNPWWPMIDQPIESVMATLAVRGKVKGLMPKDYFLALWQQGLITEKDLLNATEKLAKGTFSVEELVAVLKTEEVVVKASKLFSDVVDQTAKQQSIPWGTEIVHQLSQFCGAYFDRGQASWKPDAKLSLYEAWRQNTVKDKGIGWVMNAPGIHHQFAQLPESADELLTLAVSEMGIPAEAVTAYCHSLLLSINGWASWCAYLEWQSRLAGDSPTIALMQELLAMRLAWELVLYRHTSNSTQKSHWLSEFNAHDDLVDQMLQQQQPLWIWQQAMEAAYQSQVIAQLTSGENSLSAPAQPKLQAAFCIDVRSEVFRRHLEALDNDIQTLGFAGFFGLPVSYKPADSHYQRAQLPGLLAPVYQISEAVSAGKGRQKLSLLETWGQFKHSAPATFGFVESAGLSYLAKLLKSSVGWNADNGDPAINTATDEPPQLTVHQQNNQEISLAEKVALAKGVLSGMGLTENFAPLVLLVGHGSVSCNNPHRAGLDCGACGGHSGEVNSRALAHLLNDDDVRVELAKAGIVVPEETQFIPALHNTTTDEISLFDVELYLGQQPQLIEPIEHWLQQAKINTAEERLAKLDGADDSSTLKKRGQDWSQVRPEWGLAGNAAFIVAPRQRTRGLDLQGRTFLHDYDYQKDTNFAVLEQIITAPMVVTNWINTQYYASVVNNEKYGSGNKVLHNVVGGNIGVFEGNGGDLRTGLSLQSIHNGENWMHQPLRLSVFIDAPKAAITDIVNRHTHIKQLVENEWLSLWQIGEKTCERLIGGQWEPLNNLYS